MPSQVQQSTIRPYNVIAVAELLVQLETPTMHTTASQLHQRPSKAAGLVRVLPYRSSFNLMPRWNSNGAFTESLLIITGTMGAGKTAVLAEASDILALRHIPHAAIDLDALGLAHLPPAANNDAVMYRNLESICKNYSSLGVRRILLARAMENRAELELCRGVVSATNTVVCRLHAGIEAMELRVKMRESGVALAEYVARVSKLNIILDHARLEDFTVSNENRSLTEVAHEILVKAGWISS